jgi:glutamyl-tRNA reductase
MNAQLLCLGLNHKTAPVALRERLAFDEPAARSGLELLRDRYPQAEFVILSTCNRSEIYAHLPPQGPCQEEQLRAFLGTFHHVPRDQYDSSLYALSGAEGLRHLFSVACGLDSLVIGEDQVLGQLKEALRLARSLSAAGAGLEEVFQLAFNVAKHARRQTCIATGKVSVPSVAVELARECCGDLSDKCALSVGAGKMNAMALRLLRLAGVGQVLVCNRSAGRAEELAAACAGQAVPFEQLTQALARADVAVCSTSASDPVITASQVRAALARRPGRTLLVIDIAVPRDVEEAAGRLPGVRLYNIDDLRAVVEKNISLRTGQIDACAMIIDQHVREYFHRLHVRRVAPAIEDLYQRMRAIGDEEIAAARNRLTGDPAEDHQVMRHAFHRALRRILHVPMSNLRAAAGTDQARQLAAALLKLFNLNRPGQPPRPS